MDPMPLLLFANIANMVINITTITKETGRSQIEVPDRTAYTYIGVNHEIKFLAPPALSAKILKLMSPPFFFFQMFLNSGYIYAPDFNPKTDITIASAFMYLLFQILLQQQIKPPS